MQVALAAMYSRDTIAAISTASGAGGIAIVRVSGPQALAVGRRVFGGFARRDLESHRFYSGRILSAAGDTIDHGLGVVMRAPRSSTGEDVVELHCHGGMLLARTVLASTLASGARAAERGEFTLRAFLNGKLDLSQAESVADMIAARTPAALRAAASNLEGGLSGAVGDLRRSVVDIAAQVEAAIDFSEDDVGELDRRALTAAAHDCAERARRLSATFAHGRLLREGARVAIVGKPNVGKSSLLNALVESDRAIVTAVAGTTRDVIEESIDVDGMPVVLLDTAGVRPTGEEVERLGIARTLREIASADLVLVVFDASRPFDEEDAAVIDAVRQARVVPVVNKIDIEPRHAFAAGVVPGSTAIVEVSAERATGIAALRTAIHGALRRDAAGDAGAVIVTRERHHRALEAAIKRLDAAAASLRDGLPPDIVAVDLMGSLDELGDIVGKTTCEDVLDRVFAEFCIGK